MLARTRARSQAAREGGVFWFREEEEEEEETNWSLWLVEFVERVTSF